MMDRQGSQYLFEYLSGNILENGSGDGNGMNHSHSHPEALKGVRECVATNCIYPERHPRASQGRNQGQIKEIQVQEVPRGFRQKRRARVLPVEERSGLWSLLRKEKGAVGTGYIVVP